MTSRALLCLIVTLAAVGGTASAQSSAGNVPRTPDGRPDLQGICHEGNVFMVEGILGAARTTERDAEEAARRQPK